MVAMTPSSVLITNHAVKRYQQRVRPVSAQIAVQDIRAVLITGHARSRPRHWTECSAGTVPGSLYVYSAQHPDVCVVVKDGIAVTVFSRRICAAWRARREGRFDAPVRLDRIPTWTERAAA
jgi:hypothetical protein